MTMANNTDHILTQLEGIPVTLRINGETHEVSVPAHRTLLDTLRDDLCMTGSKKCCADGECGACTIFLDGKLVNSCLVLAAEAEDHDVVTIEGLSVDGLSDLQQEFLNAGAVQCGVCIPGQVVAAEGLLRTNPNATPTEIRDAMSGNLCRCSGYERIVTAIQAAAESRVEIS